MAPIERKYRRPSNENKKQNFAVKQEPSKRTQRRTSFVWVPTIMTARQAPINYRQHVIEQCTLTLNHACNCPNENCPVERCQSMKRVWNHVVLCQKKLETCKVCKNFQTLVAYHSRQCKNRSCKVVFCSMNNKGRYNRGPVLKNKSEPKD